MWHPTQLRHHRALHSRLRCSPAQCCHLESCKLLMLPRYAQLGHLLTQESPRLGQFQCMHATMTSLTPLCETSPACRLLMKSSPQSSPMSSYRNLPQCEYMQVQKDTPDTPPQSLAKDDASGEAPGNNTSLPPAVAGSGEQAQEEPEAKRARIEAAPST